MVRYFKMVKNGYILTIGIGSGGIEITEDEYLALYDIFMTRPDDGLDYYDLNADTLEWEKTGTYSDKESTETDNWLDCDLPEEADLPEDVMD